MKKILLTILLALTLTGCSKINLLEESTLDMNNEYLKIEIDKEKTTNEGITFKLVNISDYGKLPKGKYRLVKSFNLETNKEEFYTSQEFIIK